ncbi:MAG TPA: hypothetical protein VEI07_11990 [Planctomycetaceae bacterium]|nr:hypothetical protein [Planctomycetaceae bacterium]
MNGLQRQRASARTRRRRWMPVIGVEQLESRQLLSAAPIAAVSSPSVGDPGAVTVTAPKPENNIQQGAMAFIVSASGTVTIGPAGTGPGTGLVYGGVSPSGFINITGVQVGDFGPGGINGTINWTGQIVVSGNQASVQNGTYTATYNFGGVVYETGVPSADQPDGAPPVATSSGTWNIPAFTLAKPTASGVAKFAGTYTGTYVGTIPAVVYSPSVFANDPIVLSDTNTATSSDQLTLETNERGELYVAPGSISSSDTLSGDGTSAVTIKGPLADLQAAVNRLVYIPFGAHFQVADVLSIILSDTGDNPQQASASEQVTCVATPEVALSSPSPVNVPTGSSLLFDGGTGPGLGPTVNVYDGTNFTDQLTLSVSHGTLSLAPGVLLSGYTGPASTITVTGSPAQLSAALNNGGSNVLEYLPNAGYVGGDVLEISLANVIGDGLIDLPFGNQTSASVAIDVT